MSSVIGLRKWPLGIVFYTPSEVERLRMVNGTLLMMVEAEGEVLYKRP